MFDIQQSTAGLHNSIRSSWPGLRPLYTAPALAAVVPVGQVTEVTERGFKCEFSQRLAAGTKLYTAAPKENK